MANTVILVKYHIHHWFGAFLLVLMLLGYFVFFFIESQFDFLYTIFYKFEESFSQPIIWLIFFFAFMVVHAFENGMKLYTVIEEQEKM